MKKGTRKWFVFAVILAMMTVAACSGSNSAGNESKPDVNNQDPTSTASGSPSGDVNPFGKYDPPITLSTVRTTSAFTVYPEGDSLENNVWTRAYEEELGITLENMWVVDAAQSVEKMNVTITSGEIPDFMSVSPLQLKQLAEAGLIMDLTEIYDQYAAPLTKQIIEGDGGITLDSAKIDGKLMAIPFSDEPINQAPLLWVRQDWLDNLGLPAPQTMEDVFNIAKAFKDNDPDQDGQADTFGLGLNTDLRGFVNGYHGYLDIWIKDSSGKLVSGDIQPEVKAALSKLQELYADGYIDNEFAVKGDAKVNEDIIAGKIGIYFAPMPAPLFPLQFSYENDGAAWQAYPLVSIDDTPAKSQRLSGGFPAYYVVSKTAEHPEAVMKLANMFVEKTRGESAEPEFVYADTGESNFALANVQLWPHRKNLDIHLNVVKAEETGDTSGFKPEGMHNYEQILQYKNEGVQANWKMDRIFGVNGAFAQLYKMWQKDLFMPNEFYGVPTDSMTSKSATLLDLKNEVFTKIIMGSPLSDFDKFVEDWKNLGGDQITEEINAWYQAK